MTKIRTLLAFGLVLALAATLSPAGAQGAAAPAAADDLGAAGDVALAHIRDAAGLGAADTAEIEITDAYTSDHNGVSHVYLQQRHAGLAVLGASATVNVQNGVVVFSGHRFIADLARNATGTQTISSSQARAAAATSVDATLAEASGADLVYQALGDGTARLAYNLQVTTTVTTFIISVDAENGQVIHSDDITDYDNAEDIAARTVRAAQDDSSTPAPLPIDPILPRDGAQDGSSYRVFAMPMENPNDGERVVVNNPADVRSSPFGWHDTNGQPGPEYTITRGNNTNTYADTVPEGIPDPGSQPDGGQGLDFDHAIPTYDLTPVAYRDAAVDNLFYWNNVMHDVTASYGFNEVAGNFQTRNYTGQGAGNDAVLAEAQDGSGVNNANFSTPADGSAGRMQMYIWPSTTETRDGDFDAGIIAHEYGHGISNRLVGGPSQVGCLSHAERQGEGWSDFWSYVLTMREGDDGATPRGVGTYVLHQQNRSGAGIRITPYSTDMGINPSTYNTIKTAAAPHGVGYVWASMLWDLYWNLVDVHGFNPNAYDSWETGGNNLTIQLVIDGMKMAPCSPGFADARNAIIAADAALTGDVAGGVNGENFCLIWSTFARRGLGLSANQGAVTSKTDGTQAFDVPATC